MGEAARFRFQAVPLWVLILVWLAGVAVGYAWAWYEHHNVLFERFVQFVSLLSSPHQQWVPPWLNQHVFQNPWQVTALPFSAAVGALVSKGGSLLLQG